ncbi:MAG: DUF4832 domain-containing protein [Bacteroidales bacterium]|nr:DUF4832 domain-containing protein [Bacteroidales bacterium]
MKRLLTFFAAAALLCSCDDFQLPDFGFKPSGGDKTEKPDEKPDEPLPDNTGSDAPGGYDWTGVKYNFEESTDVIANPERGFMKYQDFKSKTSALKASAVKAQRAEGRTLYYTGYYLTDFMNGDISEAFLQKIQDTMDALREGGAKCVLRFAYKESESDKPWDPTEEIVMRHIAQLKPILQRNEDVIFVLQAGFVGVWGEWYYTTNFKYQPSTNDDYLPRKRVAEALLDALPASRQVELRTPQFKMRMYGLSLKDTLTAKTAHKGQTLDRLAGHNDCFGAAYDDWGTFDNESNDRAFWKAETRYTIMGGETCNVSDYCTCQASTKDMVDYHWTYLNIDYHTSVINGWKNNNCYNEIVNRLGYRLVLQNVERKEDLKAGEDLEIAINFRNDGYAAPMNPRRVELVFVDASGKETKFQVASDPRKWQPGAHTVLTKFKLPAEKGTLYLNLSDPLLPNNPLYSIAFANKNVFDSKTGYNKLFELK